MYELSGWVIIPIPLVTTGSSSFILHSSPAIVVTHDPDNTLKSDNYDLLAHIHSDCYHSPLYGDDELTR